jgi:hypothetical protein
MKKRPLAALRFSLISSSESLIVTVILILRKCMVFSFNNSLERVRSKNLRANFSIDQSEQRLLVVFSQSQNQSHEFPHILKGLTSFIGEPSEFLEYSQHGDQLEAVRTAIGQVNPTHVIFAGPACVGGIGDDFSASLLLPRSTVVIRCFWDAKVKRSVVLSTLLASHNQVLVSTSASHQTMSELYGRKKAIVSPFFAFHVDSQHPLLVNNSQQLNSRGVDLWHDPLQRVRVM